MAWVHDGIAVKTVVSKYVQGLSPWTIKSRRTSVSIPIVPVISISSLVISKSIMQDIGLHKNDLDSRVDDERRDTEDPREACWTGKGKEKRRTF